MIQKANSGHPGLPMGASPIAYLLWKKQMIHCPSHPNWKNRDRFVLSPGHGSALLYSLLHLSGYPLSLDELKNFRQWGSLTPGHPEAGITPGVECTTGPLGQGTAVAVGMAIAERYLAQTWNKPHFPIVDHHTYAIVSDGDLMEGISSEAAALAGHLKLGKLTYLYDANDITLDGPADLHFTENVGKRFESFGWEVLQINNADTDYLAIESSLQKAKENTEQPTLIICKTTIGYGSPNKAGKSSSHGSPLGEEEVILTKKSLGWEETTPFFIPEEVKNHYAEIEASGKKAMNEWSSLFAQYEKEYPEDAKSWNEAWSGELSISIDDVLKSMDTSKSEATRKSSGRALNLLADAIPHWIGGDADLSCSTGTRIKSAPSFLPGESSGRNIHYGVREHAMAGIANGICYHGGVRPFVSTFFVFSDYMKPSIRLACIDELNPIYVWTHDSIGLGEDGPTHQPIEHLMALRAIPQMNLIRPGSPAETKAAWKVTALHQGSPIGLVLTRQNLPSFEDQDHLADELSKGAYVFQKEKDEKIDLILIATGSELSIALEAQRELETNGYSVRVVSFPCWEFFEKQSSEYQKQVFPPECRKRISIEAGTTQGWEKWVGFDGKAIGINRFGASAPGEINFQKLGIHTQAVIDNAYTLLR
tara:strand:- start:4570 stop:6513 length:1944 start_codon:yes stop_codon:yes gene_type:complete